MTVEYCTHPTIGTVHLCGPAPTHPKVRPRTLCGVLLTADWAMGDETFSGLAATCGRCRQLFQPLGIPNAQQLLLDDDEMEQRMSDQHRRQGGEAAG